MAYIQLEDFKLGIDRRKSRVTGTPGSLWTLVNGHITRGGEIEQARAFVPSYEVPGTVGLAAVNGRLYVFGEAEGVDVPLGITYQRLVPLAENVVLEQILDAEAFDGKIYAVAQFSNGDIHHFYDGVRVSAWDDLAASIANNTAVADAFALRLNADGTGVTATVSVETVASGSFRVSAGTESAGVNQIVEVYVNSVAIMGAAVDWVTSNSATATAIAAQINSNTSTPEYVASALGDVVTLTALAGTGVGPHGYLIDNAVAGDANTDSETPFSGGGSIDLIVTATSGEPFTLGATVTNGGDRDDNVATVTQLVASRAAVPEVLSSGSVRLSAGSYSPGVNKITSLFVNGVDILGAAVDWSTSHSATVTAIVAQINSYTSSPEYTAVAVGPTIRLTALAGTGAGPNGYAISAVGAGTVAFDTIEAFAGGAAPVTAIAQSSKITFSGAFEPRDFFTVTLNSRVLSLSGGTAGTGTTATTFKKKVFSTTASILYYSELNNPNKWVDGIGSGFINMTNQTTGSEVLTAVAEFQGKMAIFSVDSIRIWNIFEDDAQNAFQQAVQNSGTASARSVVSYGNADVFYLDSSGVRSLRPRANTDSANTNDVGSAIDGVLKPHMRSLTREQVERAVALMDPEDGRYWLALGERIYVFSHFPDNSISAWSYYEPGFSVDHLVQASRRTFARADDVIYQYGGASGDVYPEEGETPVLVEGPFLSGGTPATKKDFTGIDIAIPHGSWKVELLTDPARPLDDEDSVVLAGTFAQTTYADGAVECPFESTHVGFRLTSVGPGPAVVASMAFHYKDEHSAE